MVPLLISMFEFIVLPLGKMMKVTIILHCAINAINMVDSDLLPLTAKDERSNLICYEEFISNIRGSLKNLLKILRDVFLGIHHNKPKASGRHLKL